MTLALDISKLLSRRILSAIRNFSVLSTSRLARRVPMAFSDVVPPDNTDGGCLPAAIAVFRQALITFPPSKEFPGQLEKLRSMMSHLTAEDLGLDPIFSDISLWKSPRKPPCTYIEVFQNQDINMSIFVLGPGYKMPLHDHPDMHGLLKVVSGAVRIRSFTEQPPNGKLSIQEDQSTSAAERTNNSAHKRRKFFAKITATVTCGENTETCVLTPTTSNYHEIEAIEGPAAFLDILSPPYDGAQDGTSRRRCHYYKVLGEVGPNIVEMQEIDVPDHFYCDQAPYLGPLLS